MTLFHLQAPIELPDNNFIALRTLGVNASVDNFILAASNPAPLANKSIGVWTGGSAWQNRNLLYVEFQSGQDGNIDFQALEHYELFDLSIDPWQLQVLIPHIYLISIQTGSVKSMHDDLEHLRQRARSHQN